MRGAVAVSANFAQLCLSVSAPRPSAGQPKLPVPTLSPWVPQLNVSLTATRGEAARAPGPPHAARGSGSHESGRGCAGARAAPARFRPRAGPGIRSRPTNRARAREQRSPAGSGQRDGAFGARRDVGNPSSPPCRRAVPERPPRAGSGAEPESKRRSGRLTPRCRGAGGRTERSGGPDGAAVGGEERRRRRRRRRRGAARRAEPSRAGEERPPGAFPAPRSIVPRPHVGGRRTRRLTAAGIKARRAPSGARCVPPRVPRTPPGEVGAPPPGAEQQERGGGRGPEGGGGGAEGGGEERRRPRPSPGPALGPFPSAPGGGGGPGAGLGRGARPMGAGGGGGRRGRPRPSGGAQPMGGGGGAGRPRVPSRWAPPPRGPGGRGRRAAPEAQK